MKLLAALAVHLRQQAGQTLAEYGIMVSVIAVVVIVAALVLGVSVTGLFSKSSGGL